MVSPVMCHTLEVSAGSATSKEATLEVCTVMRAVVRLKLEVPRALCPENTAGYAPGPSWRPSTRGPRGANACATRSMGDTLNRELR